MQPWCSQMCTPASGEAVRDGSTSSGLPSLVQADARAKCRAKHISLCTGGSSIVTREAGKASERRCSQLSGTRIVFAVAGTIHIIDIVIIATIAIMVIVKPFLF